MVFWALEAFAALFVWISSQGLPERVASHFDAAGGANGFMARPVYVAFMMVIVVTMPIIVHLLLIFLCYVQWLVVRANALTPPVLSSPWFVAGLVCFVLGTLVWLGLMIGRFRNVSR